MRHEDAVEARGFMRARELLDIIDVDDRTLRRMRFGHLAGLDHADEFDGHVHVSLNGFCPAGR